MTVRALDLDTARRNPTPDNNTDIATGVPFFEVNPGDADANGVLKFGTLDKEQNSATVEADDLDNRVLDNTNNPVGFTQPQAWLIGNTGVIYRAGDLARMVLLGPTSTRTVAEVWHATATNVAGTLGAATKEFRLTDFMINPFENFSNNFDGGPSGNIYTDTRITSVDPTPAERLYRGRITYGAELLNRVTTLSPNNDGLDNDGDRRIDDDDEQLIPGRINLNTAGRDLLARALPFDRWSGAGTGGYADSSARKRALIDLIVGLRDDPDRSISGGVNRLSRREIDRAGLMWTGELLESLAGGQGSLLTLDVPASDQVLTASTDFNEYEPGDGSTVGRGPSGTLGDDGLTDDREEMLWPLAALNQVASVRSDVYTAYVEVRGYPSTDFSADPVEVYRLTAVFDRSVVHESRPLPLLRSVTVF
ncbi:MAG: hypothetical protein AAGL98_11170, partial [Planctomycetota bacterium]